MFSHVGLKAHTRFRFEQKKTLILSWDWLWRIAARKLHQKKWRPEVNSLDAVVTFFNERRKTLILNWVLQWTIKKCNGTLGRSKLFFATAQPPECKLWDFEHPKHGKQCFLVLCSLACIWRIRISWFCGGWTKECASYVGLASMNSFRFAHFRNRILAEEVLKKWEFEAPLLARVRLQIAQFQQESAKNDSCVDP